MKKSLALLCCASMILMSGCAGAPPLKRYEGDRQTAPIHDLTVAVVMPRIMSMSFNGKDLRELFKTQQGMANAGAADLASAFRLLLGSVYDPEKTYRSLNGVYYQDFKNVIPVESISDPRVQTADLIALPDIKFNATTPSIGTLILVLFCTIDTGALWFPLTTTADMEVKTVFYSPDHSIVTTMSLVTPKVTKHRPMIAMPKFDDMYPTLVESAGNALDSALEHSTELRQYALGLKQSGVAEAAPAPARATAKKIIDSDVDKPSYSLDERADDYAVVVGVEQYANVQEAKFAKRDAEAVRAHLRGLGYPGQNIALLTDAQATGNKLKSYVESWLPRNVKAGSTVVVYFAGNGAPDPETKQAYLLPWDGDPQFVTDTGYPLKRLYEKLGALKAKKVVVMLDSGFTGAGGRSVLAKGARPLVGVIDAGAAGDMGNMIVLNAAGADGVTGQDDSQGHGLFTYYLLQALNETSGAGSAKQLYAALSPKVEAAARRDNVGQKPQLIGVDADGAPLR